MNIISGVKCWFCEFKQQQVMHAIVNTLEDIDYAEDDGDYALARGLREYLEKLKEERVRLSARITELQGVKEHTP